MALKTFTLVLIIITTTAAHQNDAHAHTFNPYQAGPHNTTHIHLTPAHHPGLEEEVEVWVPSDSGLYPVFYFIDGMGGVTPGLAYRELLHHLASHGVGVVVPWSVSLPINPVDKVPVLVSVMDWVEVNIQAVLMENGVVAGVVMDVDNVVLGGHSAGVHVLVEYLKGGCGQVKGQVMVSPVDGVDPFGFLPEYCITPGEHLNYVTPTLHIEAGYDHLPGAMGVACAPEDLSNARFYNAMDPQHTPKWSINATHYAHNDLMGDLYIDMVESVMFCAVNKDLTNEDHVLYRKFVAGEMLVFVKALFTNNEEECQSYLSYLELPNWMPVEVSATYNNPTNRCPSASCTWHSTTTTTTTTSTTTTTTTTSATLL